MNKFLYFLIIILPIFAIKAEQITLHNDLLKATIDIETLGVVLKSKNNKWIVSNPANPNIKYKIDNLITNSDSTEFDIGDIKVKYQLTCEGIAAKFDSNNKKATIGWPLVDLNHANLILPYQDGRFIPHDAQNWWDYLHNREFDTIESLSMPFFASQKDNSTIIWIFEQPHRNKLVFKDHVASITHNFVTLPGQKPYIVKIIVSDNQDPIEPARIYRREILKDTNLVTLKERQIKNHKLNILPGALHAYLWGNGDIAIRDIKDWQGLSKFLVNEPTIKKLYDNLRNETKKILIVAQAQNYLDKYQKSTIVADLNKQLLFIPLQDRKECLKTITAFLIQDRGHGQAVSVNMLNSLKDLGVDKARLVLVDAMDGAYHPEVAEVANDIGYLFGPYDSYDSIHDPKLKNSDSSWTTAQFPENYYNTCGMKNEQGNYYTGFQDKGRVPNPQVVWPFFKARIQENLKVPYNSYFIDVDAAGEYRDDYSPNHLLSMEQNVETYKERLKWLANKGLIVGSEKGVAAFVDVIDVAEGATSYPFFWEDKDFKDKNSKYYIGNYWPSDEPSLFFKTTPIKDKMLERQFSPAFKIPLYEYVFHDYVIGVDHWDVPTNKFRNTEKLRILTHILYQTAPIYHLNIDSIDNPIFLRSYNQWQNLNKLLAFKKLDDFKYLTTDRLVQQSKFGDISITVNYSSKSYKDIPTMSARINNNGNIQIITP